MVSCLVLCLRAGRHGDFARVWRHTSSTQGSLRESALRRATAALRSNFSSFASRGPSTTRRSAMVRRRKPRGIHAAADALDVDKLRRILAAGTDPNRVVSQGEYRGLTPLLVLCGSGGFLYSNGSREEDLLACAAALIDAGADVNFSSRNGRVTPLMLAAGYIVGALLCIVYDATRYS